MTLLVALSVAVPSSAEAGAQRYPGKAPCDAKLQRCIDKSPKGTKIRIAKNGAIKEELKIKKSVSLQPAGGFSPVIGSGSDERDLIVEQAGSRKLKVTLAGIEFRNVQIIVNLEEGGSGHRFVLQDSTLDNPLGTSNGVSGVDVSALKPGRIAILNNELATKGSPINIEAEPASGELDVTIANNRVTTSDVPAGVDTNDSATGIDVDVGGAGQADVDIYSNLVYGVAGCNCGGAAGVDIGGDSANGTVNVVGNTIDDAQFASSGLEVGDDDPGSLTVNIFDNIISNASQDVVDFPDADPGLTITHDYNDVYDPGDPPDYDDYPPGPYTDAEDPLFVDAAGADYHLQSGSPQKQQGLVCPPGGQSATDLDGNDRVERIPGQGAVITPGAFGFSRPRRRGLFSSAQSLRTTSTVEQQAKCFARTPAMTSLRAAGVATSCPEDWAETRSEETRGTTIIYGEAGQDEIDGGIGSDYLSGGDDFDVIEAHDGVEGNDVLDGGGGVDSCNPDPSDLFTNC